MAKRGKEKSTGGDSGAKVPAESITLGEIVTASQQFEGRDYSEGYPEPASYLHMRQGGAYGGKK